MPRRHTDSPNPEPTAGRALSRGHSGAAAEPDCNPIRWETTADCRHCPIRQQALFAALRGPDFGQLLTRIRNAVIPAGTALYR